MSERKRSFQFGLRKLFLWTAVVAIYCGIGNMIAGSVQPQGYPLQYLIALGLLIVLALILRVVVPSKAWHMTAAVGGVCSLLFFVVAVLVYERYPRDIVIEPIICLMVLSFGSGVAWVAFLFVEANCRFVNWIDSLVETKSDGESGSD